MFSCFVMAAEMRWTPATVHLKSWFSSCLQESSTNARFRPILVSGSGGASRLLVFQYGIFKIGYIFKYDIQQKNLQIYPVCIWQWLPLHKVCPSPLLLCAKSRTVRLLFSSSFLCCFVFIVCIYTHTQAQLWWGGIYIDLQERLRQESILWSSTLGSPAPIHVVCGMLNWTDKNNASHYLCWRSREESNWVFFFDTWDEKAIKC